jgi:PAS domain S-box-containing protein
MEVSRRGGELRESVDESVLQSALDQNPDGIVIADRSGTILYVNSSLRAMTGFTEEELVGESIETLVPARVRGHHAELRGRFLTQPRPRPMGQGLDLTAMRADGTEVPVEISLSPIGVSNDVVNHVSGPYIVASVRDVTERLVADQRLQSTREALTLSAERERIARDLHDTVLQRLFGLGLELQAVAMSAGDTAPHLETRLENAVDEIDRIIKEIRTSVFTLGAANREGSLGQEIGDILAQSARVLGFTPRLRIEGPIENMIDPALRADLVAVLRETLANVARHSRATACSVELMLVAAPVESSNVTTLELVVSDNGRGIPDDEASAGNGLRNIAARAEKYGGRFTHTPAASTTPSDRPGTRLVWSVPVT